MEWNSVLFTYYSIRREIDTHLLCEFLNNIGFIICVHQILIVHREVCVINVEERILFPYLNICLIMTVHGQQEKPYTHQNGFVSKMVYPDSETMMNRSWNGYMFHVSPLSLPNGNIATPQKAHGPPKFSNEMRANFSMSYDGDESSQFDSLDSETEYVTLDNNYFLRTFSPPSRHLSILDFKRNELNDNKTNSLTRQSHSQSLISVKSPLKDRKWQKKSLRKLATNIGAVLSLSPRGGESLRRFPEEYVSVKRERSKSVGDIVENAKYEKEDSIELCLSDDDDNDDFGFINYPKCSSSLSLAMNKTKSPSSTHKILPKRFRSKTRPVPVVNTTLWSPEVSSYIYLSLCIKCIRPHISKFG